MTENSAGYDRVACPPRVWQVVHVIGDLDLLGGLELDTRLGRELAEADQAVAVPDGVDPQPRRSPRARA